MILWVVSILLTGIAIVIRTPGMSITSVIAVSLKDGLAVESEKYAK
jgi:hypothetical protein